MRHLVWLLPVTTILLLAISRTREVRSVAHERAQAGASSQSQSPLRWEAVDEGIVFQHGFGPDACDILGARDTTIFEENGIYYLGYDGAGPNGWVGCLASSTDLVNWTRLGPILRHGLSGDADARYAGYPLLGKHRGEYFCYYVGSPQTMGKPWQVPALPYRTLSARADHLSGPSQAADYARGLELGTAGSWDEATVCPGPILSHDGWSWMIYSGAAGQPLRRSLGLVRSRSPLGPWQKRAEPILPPTEQIENASLYFEPANQTWFLFTNHIGNHDGFEHADDIWVYWSKDPMKWDARSKAVVLDAANVRWQHAAGTTAIVGLPAVVRRGDRLYIFYDGLAGSGHRPPRLPPLSPGGYRFEGDGAEHCHRDIAVASLPLPLSPPSAGAEKALDPAAFEPAAADIGFDPQKVVMQGAQTIAGETRRRSFLLHPYLGDRVSTLSFTGRVPASIAPAPFSIGLMFDALPRSDGAEFAIFVEHQTGRRCLFREFADPREQWPVLGWIDAVLDLRPFAGERVTVQLETRSGPRGDARHDWAIWSFSPLR